MLVCVCVYVRGSVYRLHTNNIFACQDNDDDEHLVVHARAHNAHTQTQLEVMYTSIACGPG